MNFWKSKPVGFDGRAVLDTFGFDGRAVLALSSSHQGGGWVVADLQRTIPNIIIHTFSYGLQMKVPGPKL